MVSKAGIEGIKMTSNLGGFPSLFLYIIVIISTSRMLIKGKNSSFLNENSK
jgi:hypothetical protein